MNNLKQQVLALHNCQDVYKRLPPMVTRGSNGAPVTFPPSLPGAGQVPGQPGVGGGIGTFHFLLLPFIEEDTMYLASIMPSPSQNPGLTWGPYGNYNVKSLYNPAWSSDGNGSGGSGTIKVHKVSAYICPSDGTIPSDAIAPNFWDSTNRGILCSYAPNQQVFGQNAPDGTYGNPDGSAQIPGTFVDGTSRTIVIAEKLARCGENSSLGDQMWDWDQVGDVQLQHPFFAVLGDVPSSSGIPNVSTNIGVTSLFLSRPTPITSRGTSVGVYPYVPNTGCDPGRASTAHTGGMQVALADGSCRSIGTNMSGITWWSACTPRSNDFMGSDW